MSVNRLYPKGEEFLHFYAGNGLAIMMGFFQHKYISNYYTLYRDAIKQKSIIDLVLLPMFVSLTTMDGAENSDA